jgi:hypothetical protein
LTALRSKWTLVALFVLGCALMLPFELWATRLAGMACLFGFIILGVFLIADPRFLSGDPPDSGEELRPGSSAD